MIVASRCDHTRQWWALWTRIAAPVDLAIPRHVSQPGDHSNTSTRKRWQLQCGQMVMSNLLSSGRVRTEGGSNIDSKDNLLLPPPALRRLGRLHEFRMVTIIGLIIGRILVCMATTEVIRFTIWPLLD